VVEMTTTRASTLDSTNQRRVVPKFYAIMQNYYGQLSQKNRAMLAFELLRSSSTMRPLVGYVERTSFCRWTDSVWNCELDL